MIASSTDTSVISLAERGWHLVPIRSGEKRPILDDWGNKASADVNQIERWSAQYPACNWGLLLGPTSGIIDVEDDSPEGREILESAMELSGVVTPCYSSGKSIHRLFESDERFSTLTAVNYQLFGCEFRFGVGGKAAQSVIPPSVHPSGAVYSWLPGLSPDDVEVARLPDDMWQLFIDLQAQDDARKAEEREAKRTARKTQTVVPCALMIDGVYTSHVAAAEAAIDQIPFDSLLIKEGWTHHTDDEWTRPGDGWSNAKSATLNVYDGQERLTVWTNAAPIPGGTNDKQSNYSRWRFWYQSNGFLDNDQVNAAKAFLGEQKSKEIDAAYHNRDQGQDPVDLSGIDGQAKKHGPVGDSPLKPYANGTNADKFEAFPLKSIPPVLRRFVTESAAAIGCDPTMSVLPTLAVCASAIGTSRSLMIKRGWFVPSLIWAVVVGESGTQKSPPLKLAVKPIKDRQKEIQKENEAAWAEFSRSADDYKRAKKVWDKTGEGDRPEAPVEPTMPRTFVQDPTIESLAPILLENPRGLLLERDELSGWFGSFNQYSSGKASTDVQKWLEIYGTESITIDRKTGDQRFIFVPHPSVSICGGIQPDILSKCLTDENKSNGLQSRLLMAYPPRQPKRWRDDEVSESASNGYYELIKELSRLRPDTDISGDEKPTVLRLTDDARQLYKDFVNQHGEEQNAMHGHLASQWSKLEETPARLAIVLHCVRQVTDGVDDAFKVDATTMSDALTLAEWFKAECLRINRLLAEPQESRETRRLINWIGCKGGRITARDLCKHRRDIATSEEAEKLLMHLVSIGAGTWSSITKSREFIVTAENVGD